MDGIDIAVLLFSVVLLISYFIAVRNKKRAEISKPPKKYEKPKLLTREQRKGLTDVLGPVKKQTQNKSFAARTIEPRTNRPTRAIKQGWSIGMVSFSYIDADGFASDRTVIAHSITDDYLKGECMDRKAERTFRLDRIIGDVVNCETGELFDPFELASSLGN